MDVGIYNLIRIRISNASLKFEYVQMKSNFIEMAIKCSREVYGMCCIAMIHGPLFKYIEFLIYYMSTKWWMNENNHMPCT